MFEGLDDIDWASFGTHIQISRKAADIPQFFRDLLSDDEDDRFWAILSLFGEGQYHGCLDTATPYIIPFVLEVLNNPTFPDREGILYALSAVGDHMLWVKTIYDMRLSVSVYDALAAGLSIYLGLLQDEDNTVRRECAHFLRYMQDEGTKVVDALMARYKPEPHAEIRAEIVDSITAMMTATSIYADTYSACLPFFSEVMKDGTALPEKVAAAKAMLNFDARTRMYTQEVHALIGDVFAAAGEDQKFRDDKTFQDQIAEYEKRQQAMG